ncbi:DUF2267 domain-containing protein [Streptomyces sp. NPDC004520]|uniref:DUF2267 domain-containing protein n=1 Tax=Streptomyces sp. NPDC004520 TaxID=3364702 RepID=UPI00367417CC
MPETTPHPDFEHAIHTANTRLKAVSEALGTGDRHAAHRVLWAWLPTLRDRLTVDVAAHFAAQLPDLLRGACYDGWDPSTVPVRYGREGHVDRFAQEAKVTAEEVPRIAPAVTASYANPSRPDTWRRHRSNCRTTSRQSSFSRPADRRCGFARSNRRNRTYRLRAGERAAHGVARQEGPDPGALAPSVSPLARGSSSMARVPSGRTGGRPKPGPCD